MWNCSSNRKVIWLRLALFLAKNNSERTHISFDINSFRQEDIAEVEDIVGGILNVIYLTIKLQSNSIFLLRLRSPRDLEQLLFFIYRFLLCSYTESGCVISCEIYSISLYFSLIEMYHSGANIVSFRQNINIIIAEKGGRRTEEHTWWDQVVNWINAAWIVN